MKNYDLIIIGAGTAGMPCAIFAAENGANVLVVEKSNEVGGTLHITGGHMSGGGTKRQKEIGIEDSPKEQIEDILRISKGTADNEIMKLAVRENPKALDWLDELSFEFDEETPRIIYGHEAYSNPRTVFGKNAGKSILKAILPIWKKYVAEEEIKVLLEHELTDLIFEDNEVKGVKVTNKDEEFEVFGKAIVLATGGYGSNPDFFKKVTSKVSKIISTTRHTSTGDGIIIAQKHDAKFHNAENHFVTLGGIELEPDQGRCDWWGAWAMVYTSIYRRPREIYVNVHGERFMNEDEQSADKREHFVMEQSEQKFWLIFDDVSIDDEEPLVRGWNAKTLREKSLEEKVIWQAETISELADKIGIDKENLIESVEKYNESIETQQDAFNREYLKYQISKPPFYALLTHGSTLVTFGGLAIDTNLNILREDGKPIKNLYAIGEVLGAGVMNGEAFCSGMLITPAIGLGRHLGIKLGKKFANI